MQEIDGHIDADYRFEVMGSCSLSTEGGGEKFLLTKGELGPLNVLNIEDYKETGEYQPLEGEELEQYLMYYIDRYKRETGKSFLKRMGGKMITYNKK